LSSDHNHESETRQAYTLQRELFPSADALAVYLDEIWEDPEFRRALADAAVPLQNLPARRSELIAVEQDSAAFGPVESAVIVAFAPLAAQIAKDVWSLMFAWIEKRHGVRALTKKKKRR
jgi:hypothetical protein